MCSYGSEGMFEILFFIVLCIGGTAGSGPTVNPTQPWATKVPSRPGKPGMFQSLIFRLAFFSEKV